MGVLILSEMGGKGGRRINLKKPKSIAILEQENKWAVRHVANREEQIAELREGFSDEVNLCLDVVIDPVFAP